VSEAIQLGQGFNDRLIAVAAHIHHCLLESWKFETEVISGKCAANTIELSHFLNCTIGGCHIRYGKGNVLRGLAFTNSGARSILIMGDDNDIIGCETVTPGNGIQIFAGTATLTGMTSNSQYPASLRSRVVGGNMASVDGAFFGGLTPTVNATYSEYWSAGGVSASVGSQGAYNATTNPAGYKVLTGQPGDIANIPAALYLTAAQVGLGAPWDL
jgi:hypothetical protein